MQFVPKNVRRFQVGGEMKAPAPEEMAPEGGGMEQPAPEETGGGQDPLMLLAQAAAQALQTQDCQMAMQVCQGFIQLIQQAQGGGGAPAAEEGAPVFGKGGVLKKRIRK